MNICSSSNAYFEREREREREREGKIYSAVIECTTVLCVQIDLLITKVVVSLTYILKNWCMV